MTACPNTHIVSWANSDPVILGCERVNSGHDPSITVGHHSIIQQAAIQFHQLPMQLLAMAFRGNIHICLCAHKLNMQMGMSSFLVIHHINLRLVLLKLRYSHKHADTLTMLDVLCGKKELN